MRDDLIMAIVAMILAGYFIAVPTHEEFSNREPIKLELIKEKDKACIELRKNSCIQMRALTGVADGR